MELDLERIALGNIVGVTGATVAAGAGRECNQRSISAKNSMRSPGRTGLAFMILMRVARIASAHEYVHHVVNMNLSFLRAFDADNAEEVPRRHLECLGFPRQHRELDNDRLALQNNHRAS